MAEADTILELRGITKVFPGIVADDHVDFDLRRGEVHALLGENGAGKSTLMNILYGLYRPDDGEIVVRGQPVTFHSAKDAIAAGIGMVHQHFMLIPVMTVAENIVLGLEPTRDRVFIDEKRAAERVRDLSRAFGLALDPNQRIEKLTVGQQQRVEILKALYRKADILILDEPTAVLTPQEAKELFGIIETLKREGTSIIFISHKLGEGLEVLDDRQLPAVRGVSFEVRAGEIVGIAGVDGNGQSELIDGITGLRRPAGGTIRVAGREVAHSTPRLMLDLGVGHIPEDRQRRGLVLEFSIAENVALHDYAKEPDSK